MISGLRAVIQVCFCPSVVGEKIATDVSVHFVNNADLMDQRKKDYRMSAEFEGASGITKLHVGRNWSTTLIAGGAVVVLLLILFRNLI